MEPLFTAIPTKSYTTLLFLLFITIGLILLVVLVQTNKFKKLQGSFKQLSFLIGSLLAFLFLATTILTTWNLYRIQPIQFFKDHLECYQGRIPYKEIVQAGIYTDEQKSMVNPEIALKQHRMLVIERKDKQTAIFSEDYYDVEVLVKRIREMSGK